MADTPAVSVITSVYDGMPYLAESIRSILAQRFSDFEYLIVDDGSTDDSWETLQAFAAADRRIRLLRNPANWGFARSQNRALELAGGRYVACQDQDDLSHPDRLARQVEFLDSNPQVGVVGTWPHFIDPNGDTLDNGRYPLLAGNGSIQERLLVGFGMIGPSIVVRRPLLTAVAGYDPDSPAAEDYDLILRLSEITQLANVPEGLYRYRLHPDSVSSRRASLQAHSMAQARERALRRRFGDSAPAELTAVAARTYLRSALLQLATGTGPEAGPSIDRALALHPQLIDDG